MRSAVPRTLLPFVTYVGTGAVATTAHYAVLMLLVELLGIAAPVAAATGAVLGGTVSYAFNRRYTFRSSAAHVQAVPRFAVTTVLLALANGVLVQQGTQMLGWPYLLAQLAATAILLGVGFALHRRWSFS
jgi:putative flippase GtrA